MGNKGPTVFETSAGTLFIAYLYYVKAFWWLVPWPKYYLKNLDRLLCTLQTRVPSLTYLSLLGNEACPNQLSSQDKDDDDYRRYR